MALTLDIWSIPPESARRVGHPAPFPVELPEQLIRLYTFEDDLVLDPFMGSGSALVAAARLGRRYVGYDLDARYVEIARRRVAEATSVGDAGADARRSPAATRSRTSGAGRRATAGRAALAEELLGAAGFEIDDRNRRIRGTGVTVDFVATDADGDDVVLRRGRRRSPATAAGCCAPTRCGRRSAGPPRCRDARGDVPLVLLTTHLPRRPSEGDTALRAAGPAACFDVDRDALRRRAASASPATPPAGGATARSPASGRRRTSPGTRRLNRRRDAAGGDTGTHGRRVAHGVLGFRQVRPSRQDLCARAVARRRPWRREADEGVGGGPDRPDHRLTNGAHDPPRHGPGRRRGCTDRRRSARPRASVWRRPPRPEGWTSATSADERATCWRQPRPPTIPRDHHDLRPPGARLGAGAGGQRRGA